ncbi:MAG TPA: DNA-directed RNA polymerase subunit H [Candidatus Nanoarchaeia archaeon]|nr:DNA-directed RNA polymerase subunit H [Candidatus Nanoarchaeia archaeon]
MAEVTFDIRKHLLVPKHEKLNDEAAQQVLQAYHIERKHLPKISAKDPAIQLLGPHEGDIIKITRDSPTAGKFTFFRVVTE